MQIMITPKKIETVIYRYLNRNYFCSIFLGLLYIRMYLYIYCIHEISSQRHLQGNPEREHCSRSRVAAETRTFRMVAGVETNTP